MKRSKKFALMLFSCIWGLPVQAQESSLPAGFTTGDNIWIVRAGLTFNNVSGDGVLDTKANWAATNGAGEFENALGGTISFGLYCPLGSGPFYFGANAGAGIRGYKTSAKWQEGIYSLTSQETKCLQRNSIRGSMACAQADLVNEMIPLMPAWMMMPHGGTEMLLA